MIPYRFLPLAVIFYLSLLTLPSHAQSVPEPVTNTPLYEFLAELAIDGIIDLNSAVKPYSRQTILALLELAAVAEDQLTVRQQKELDFYLADFRGSEKDGKMHLVYNPSTARYQRFAVQPDCLTGAGLDVWQRRIHSLEERCEGLRKLWQLGVLRSTAGQPSVAASGEA